MKTKLQYDLSILLTYPIQFPLNLWENLKRVPWFPKILTAENQWLPIIDLNLHQICNTKNLKRQISRLISKEKPWNLQQGYFDLSFLEQADLKLDSMT